MISLIRDDHDFCFDTCYSMQYHHRKTTTGIDLYILETGAQINAEAEAMLQALHSRSVGGIRSHLQILAKKWATNFMSQFYVWYGHKSIGDCGSMTIFIEWCSMLAAKAIQDSKLYNGQEASTRYIDFSQQMMINPIKHSEGTKILEDQRLFYLELLPALQAQMLEMYPAEPDDDPKVHTKTINAKAFDIARGFLPAGCSTNLARHTTLRQVADRILHLRHHPLEEVRDIAHDLLQLCIEVYPSSFSDKQYEATEQYYNQVMQSYYHHNRDCPVFAVTHDGIDRDLLQQYHSAFTARPNNKTELPPYLDIAGTLTVEYLLDFWSFRDIQRHRAPSQRMPLLTADIGFHDRYLESVPQHLLSQTLSYLATLRDSISRLTDDHLLRQYYLPMGYQISNQLIGTIPALVYLSELRSSTYVHPTLRPIAHQIWQYLIDMYDISLFMDRAPDGFDIRRGNHDIEIKV